VSTPRWMNRGHAGRVNPRIPDVVASIAAHLMGSPWANSRVCGTRADRGMLAR
jgi:hypothetical protein